MFCLSQYKIADNRLPTSTLIDLPSKDEPEAVCNWIWLT